MKTVKIAIVHVYGPNQNGRQKAKVLSFTEYGVSEDGDGVFYWNTYYKQWFRSHTSALNSIHTPEELYESVKAIKHLDAGDELKIVPDSAYGWETTNENS